MTLCIQVMQCITYFDLFIVNRMTTVHRVMDFLNITPHLPPHFQFPPVINQHPEAEVLSVCWRNLTELIYFTKAVPEAAVWSCLYT